MFKRFHRTLFLICIIFVLASTFSGCKKHANTKEISKNKITETLVVTDQIGREVTIKGNVEKIVSSYYITSSLLIALGVSDKVVGIEMLADTRELYKRAAPEFLNLPAIGSGKGVNIEEIASLEPDIVIIPLKLKDTVSQFEQLNIPVLVVNPETMDDFINCVALISKAVGVEEKGIGLMNYYINKMDEIKLKTSKLENKPTIYLSAGSDYLSTCTSKMYQNDLIKMSGGINVSSELQEGYWQNISAEQLLNWNPEYMLMVGYSNYSKDDILKDIRLSEVNAVKNNNIDIFPSRIEPWDYPTPSSVLGILWLTNKLHPEIYSTNDYIKEAEYFYKTYFNIEINKEDMGL